MNRRKSRSLNDQGQVSSASYRYKHRGTEGPVRGSRPKPVTGSSTGEQKDQLEAQDQKPVPRNSYSFKHWRTKKRPVTSSRTSQKLKEQKGHSKAKNQRLVP